MTNHIISDFGHYAELVTSDLFDRHIFRGVSDGKLHHLLTPIGRSPRWSGLSTKKLTAAERAMLKRFKQEGAPFVSQPMTDWDWMVLARHHGLPGRLLDWSKNPLVALFFAVQGGNNTEGAVYADSFSRTIQTTKAADPFKVTEVSKLLSVHSHARISAQASVLTVHPDPREAYSSRTMVCLRISGKLKVNLKQALRRLGIHPATIYQDLEGVAQGIYG